MEKLQTHGKHIENAEKLTWLHQAVMRSYHHDMGL